MFGGVELVSVFVIAFIASLGHCVGMCGGIVLAYSTLHLRATSYFKQIAYHLAYNLGRISTYALLGCIVGGLGQALMISEVLKYNLMLLIGVLLVIFGFGLLFLPKLLRFFEFSLNQQSLFSRAFKALFKKNSSLFLYALGVLNGFLPCGIVYYFLLSASIAGSSLNGGIVMAIFGLATLPTMLLFGFFSSFLQSKRQIFLKISAVLMIAFGLYEIYQGFHMWGITL